MPISGTEIRKETKESFLWRLRSEDVEGSVETSWCVLLSLLPRGVDLGLIQEAKYDHKKGYDFRTEQGWFHVEYNEELTILLDDHVGWCELFD